MRIISFRTPKPKSFKYNPRYYDEKKEELEKRKAAMGLDSRITHDEGLRLRMDKRWRAGSNNVEEKSILARIITYLIYTIFIGGSIYIIMFTDIVEQILRAFGVTK
jgi:hypothetical protein